MSEWKEYKLGEIISLHRGYDLPSSQRKKGTIPIVSSSGISDYHDSYKMLPPGVVTGRYGTIGEVFFLNEPYWPLNTTLYIDDFKGNDPLFIYYFLKSFDFEKFNDKSTIPGINRNHLYGEVVKIPSLDEQKRIASILSSLDDKIDLLNRENTTLEAMAETLFRQWFIEEAKEDWEEIPFGKAIEVFDYKRKPLSKMERDKMKDSTPLYPYYGAAEIMDYINSYIFDGEYILMGEDGTVKTDDGYPILQYATGKFWPNNHTHVIQAKYPYNNCFIWNYLKTTNIENIVTGAVQPKINQANMLSLPFYSYPIRKIEEYQSITQPWWNKTIKNKEQTSSLIKQRNILLPKLMTKEIQL